MSDGRKDFRSEKKPSRTQRRKYRIAAVMAAVLVLGLAHFSGATLRRPNVSIWLSLILALIYYVTEVLLHAADDHHPGLEC